MLSAPDAFSAKGKRVKEEKYFQHFWVRNFKCPGLRKTNYEMLLHKYANRAVSWSVFVSKIFLLLFKTAQLTGPTRVALNEYTE